jgi:hypothetical protein
LVGVELQAQTVKDHFRAVRFMNILKRYNRHIKLLVCSLQFWKG